MRLEVVAPPKVVLFSPFPVGHSEAVIMGGSLSPSIRGRERERDIYRSNWTSNRGALLTRDTSAVCASFRFGG